MTIVTIAWVFCVPLIWLVGWLVVLRIYVDLAIFQPYLDLEAGDNQSLKIQVARPGIEPGPLAPQAKSLTTRPPLLLSAHLVTSNTQGALGVNVGSGRCHLWVNKDKACPIQCQLNCIVSKSRAALLYSIMKWFRGGGGGRLWRRQFFYPMWSCLIGQFK